MAGLTACGSDNNSSSSSSGGSSSTTSAAGGSSSTSSSSSSTSGSSSITCANGTIAGQGSTAQTTAVSAFVKTYQTKCGNSTNVSYNGTGSGPGVTAFTQKQADFAGSDFALNATQQPGADQRCGSGGKALSVATVPGVIAVMYNIPNVSKLNLSATTLAKIFNSKITNWNDPAIATDNPGVTLPNLAIQSFHRSDGSGTSYNFSNYLNKTAASDFPTAANKQWPGTGGQGQQGSKGVAQAVQSTSGAIGYAEVSYANSNHLNTANIGNTAGHFVPLTIPNAANFINKAAVDTSGGNYKFNFDYTYSADDAYPAVLVTYEIVCSTGNDSAKLPLLKGFLSYLASADAQSQLPNLGYVSLSSSQQSAVEAIYAGLS
jgi:phosphate transport system substrate-binding protein